MRQGDFFPGEKNKNIYDQKTEELKFIKIFLEFMRLHRGALLQRHFRYAVINEQFFLNLTKNWRLELDYKEGVYLNGGLI